MATESKRLDDNQIAAVDFRGKALMMIAGAGAGKTYTVIRRILSRLMDDGMPSKELLALTFSRKACREIINRLAATLDSSIDMPSILTYHSFGYRLIRTNPAACNRRTNPTLMDEPDQRRMFRAALSAYNITPQRFKDAAARYDQLRNKGLDPESPEHQKAILNIIDHANTNYLLAYQHYEKLKRGANTLDYNDLIVLPLRGFLHDPDWLERTAGSLGEIIVDESQDTNLVQYKLIYLLGKTSPGCISMVGDDDQTIYCWRGAAPDNLKRFQRDFQPEIIHLSKNYRSTPEIVSAANRLIAHNSSRLEKTSIAHASPSGINPSLETYRDGDDMARNVVAMVKKELDAGVPPHEISLLYRVNRLAKVLEPELIANGIPYQIQKGTELGKRQEVQMLFAAIRLAINPNDAPALGKMTALINGFGEKRFQALIDDHTSKSTENGEPIDGCSLLDRSLYHAPNSNTADAMYALRDAIADLRETGPGDTNLLKWAAGFTPFSDWIKKMAKSATNPLENLNSRLDSLALFDRAIASRIANTRDPLTGDTPEERWQQVLEMVLSSPDTETAEGNAVRLSSIHQFKGLESEIVHVIGFSEGLMPSITGDKDEPEPEKNRTAAQQEDQLDDTEEGADGIEEERRLAFVALTRAKRKLHLHHADRINLPGQDRHFQISRFAKESDIEITHRAPHAQQKEQRGEKIESTINPFMAAFHKTSGRSPAA